MFVDAVSFLNLSRAVGQLQSSEAQQATQNDHARLLLARKLLMVQEALRVPGGNQGCVWPGPGPFGGAGA